MEMLDGDELDYYAALRSESITLVTKIQLLINIIHGLRQIHICDIVHLDLKPINILVCRGLITKIIDFGEAYHREACQKGSFSST